MKFNPTTPWHMTYAARFKPIQKSQVDAIEASLYDSMKATIDEMGEAMASIASMWQFERVPNINDLANAIKAIRGELSGNVTTPNHVDFYKGDKRGTTTMRDLKGYLSCKPTPDRAWEVICIPLLVDQCRELQRHCDEKGIEYARFVPPKSIYSHELIVNAASNSTNVERYEPNGENAACVF